MTRIDRMVRRPSVIVIGHRTIRHVRHFLVRTFHLAAAEIRTARNFGTDFGKRKCKRHPRQSRLFQLRFKAQGAQDFISLIRCVQSIRHGSVLPEITGLESSQFLPLIKGQAACSAQVRLQAPIIVGVDLGIGGENHDLISGIGKVVVDDVIPVRAVQSGERCVDDDREFELTGLCQPPQQRDSEHLLFTRRQAGFFDLMPITIADTHLVSLVVDRSGL